MGEGEPMSVRRSRRATLGGRLWSIRVVTRSQVGYSVDKDGKRHPHHGDCCWRTKTINIRDDQDDAAFLDTLIHEAQHGQNEILFEAESYVTRSSSEIAAAILLFFDVKRKDK